MRYLLGPSPSATPFVKTALDANVIGGTAVHFAALYVRPKCLQALIDAGCDLNAINSAGKTALILAQNPNVKTMLTAAATNGQKSLAQLAKEGKFFAIYNRMRTGRVDQKEVLTNLCEGKCATHWLLAIVSKKHVIMNDMDAPMIAQQVLMEMQHRYEFCNLSRWEQLSSTLLAAGNVADVGSGEEYSSKILYTLLEGISNLVEKQNGGSAGDSKKGVAGGKQ